MSVYSHTHHILTKPLRRGIMIMLILLFFIIAPLIILYTAGYRYDMQARTIKQTGVISIDVKPKEAQVYLNGILIDKKIPIRLTNRAPGTYHLKITYPGYRTWEKDVSIESNQTTYVKDIVLLREALPTLILRDKENPIKDVYASHLHNTLILTSQNKDGLYEISAFDPEIEQETLIVRTSATEEPIVEISPFYPIGLIWATNKQTNLISVRLFLLDDPEEVILFTIPYSDKAKYQWNSSDVNFPLYVSDGSTILAYALDRTSETIGSLDASASAWYLDRDRNLWQLYGQTISSSPSNISFTLERSDIQRLVDINDRRIIAQTNEETLVITHNKKQILNTSYLRGVHTWYDASKHEWWIWSAWEAWTIFDNGVVSSPNRPGVDMLHIQRLDEFGLTLLQTDHELYAFHPGVYISNQLLFSSPSITRAYVQPLERTIYFLGTVGQQHGLYRLEY